MCSPEGPEFFSVGAATIDRDHLFSGPGGHHLENAPLLREFSDVLQSETPRGLPPTHFAADGSC
jgi:hypothetical protein